MKKISILVGLFIMICLCTPSVLAGDSEIFVEYYDHNANEDILNDIETFNGTSPEESIFEIDIPYTFIYNTSEEFSWRITYLDESNESVVFPYNNVSVENVIQTYTFEFAGNYRIEILNNSNSSTVTYYDIYVNHGPLGAYLAIIGAGLAIGIAGMGAGIGVGIAGAGGASAIGEDSKRFGKALLFQALPQTQAIYGLLVAILILLGVGIIGGGLKSVPVPVGLSAIGAGLATGIAGLSAIGQGIAAGTGVGVIKKKESFGTSIIFSVMPETQAIYGLLVAIFILVGSGILGGGSAEIVSNSTWSMGVGFAAIGAGLAIGIAGMSAIGQGIAASAGIGATAEDKKMFGKSMIFTVLPETQAIYGLLVAIFVLLAAGFMGGAGSVFEGLTLKPSMGLGVASIGAGLAIGIAGLSAIGQGITGGVAIGTVSRNPKTFGQSVILTVMSETFAIFGLLIAIFILLGIGFL